ncbi:phosphoribosyltransferase [Williamsoniiplasma luminosum]|nr:phosphoribosyltransferase family protein [Williamsoniiplasma luminosum]
MKKFKHNLELLITKKEIHEKIKKLASSLNAQYKGKEVTIIGVMNGGLFMLADLLKKLKFKVNIDTISIANYTNIHFSKGVVWQKKVHKPIITGNDVIVIEDIIDTGYTLTEIYEELAFWNPKSIRMITLLDKEGTHPNFKYPYESLFKVPNKFIVGYGLDMNDMYRQLDQIYTVEQ